MGIIIRPQLTGTRIDQLTVREQREVLRGVMVDMATDWSTRYVPKHFTESASRKYGYQQRSAKYQRRKRQLAARGAAARGGRVDLVMTGQLERMIMASRFNIRGFPARATVTLNGPSYFRIKPRNPKRPNLAAEVTAITDQEREKLVAPAAKSMTKRIRQAVKKKPPRRFANQYSSGKR